MIFVVNAGGTMNLLVGTRDFITLSRLIRPMAPTCLGETATG
jgi:hypothetical protein